jgi:hypothetical protein
MGTITAAIPSWFVVMRAQSAPRASPRKTDLIYDAIVDSLIRNHRDLKKHGPHGEHLRMMASNVRLMIAHGQAGHLDQAAAEAVSRHGGMAAFRDFDFVTFSRSMIKQHLNEEPPASGDDGSGGGSGGGPSPVCKQVLASLDAATAVMAVACMPAIAAIFPEGCLAASIAVVDLIAVKYAMGCA